MNPFETFPPPWGLVFDLAMLGTMALLVVLVVRQARARRRQEIASRDPDAPPPVNAFAETAAISSAFLFGAPLVLAVVAMVQIYRGGDRGKGLVAIAVGVQILWVVAFALYLSIQHEPTTAR